MSVSISTPKQSGVVYPESDGQPIAENTLQFQWIVTIKEGLEALFRDRPDVLVASGFFWYPVEGDPRIRVAPDVMVVFGPPKGDRGSYLQWEEGGIAPQAIFEVRSPGNRTWEMEQKLLFYERHGVQEYYLYDPEQIELSGWKRVGTDLQEIPRINGWISPLLRIRFDMSAPELKTLRPDGRPFLTFAELELERDWIAHDRDQIAQELERARERADRLAARLRELGIDPES
jgi:Uma2 family endonuclease